MPKGYNMLTANDQLLPGAITKALHEKDEKQLRFIKAAIQAFMEMPEKRFEKAIQAFGTQADLAQVAARAFSVFERNDNFDLFYERVFDPVTLGPGQNFWEIHNVTHGLVVRKVKEGERLDVQKISGTKITAYCEKYGGALGWTDEMIRSNQVPAMQTMARVFRNAYWKEKASVHYALLLAAIVRNTTAWQGAGVNLIRDIATLSTAAYYIANACKDKYGDTANAQYVGFFHPNLKQRITAAIQTTLNTVSQTAAAGNQLLWNIQPIYSWFIPANTGIIVLPGNELQRAEALGMTSMEDNDILQLTYIQAIWAYYGAAIGDVDQIRGALFQ
jgi:hypothetical protein